MKIASLVLILFLVIVIVVGIYKVHGIPGKIARQRNHPQAEAIGVCSLLGLLIFPFWMVALLWAYMRPVLKPLELGTDSMESSGVASQPADGEHS